MDRRVWCVGAVLLLSIAGGPTLARRLFDGQRAPAAAPVDAISAIIDAFKSHQLVAIGDAHGNEPGQAFQFALMRDRRFPAAVNDILVETGNSAYQGVLDRFIRGENVPEGELRPIWRETAQQQVASWQMPELFKVVRAINDTVAPEHRLRVLLGEPPIDWGTIRSADDLRGWQSDPAHERDRFAVDVLKRDVLGKGRRAIAFYGAGHFFRKNVTHSIVSLMESGGASRAFTVWTNSVADMSTMQPDVASWPTPSIARVRGTLLGEAPFEAFFGPAGTDIPNEWKAPMQEQFDAVLYVGPPASIKFARAERWPCNDPAFAERLRRAALIRPSIADRLKKDCLP
jgi:hypothetical protein